MMNRKALTSGVWLYGLASAASGLLDFLWANFDPSSQPVQAFSDHILGQQALARIAAAWLVVAGLSVLSHRWARVGSVALVIAYTVFAICWLPRFRTAPHFLGYHAGVYFGVFGGVAEELILVGAGLLIYALWPNRKAGFLSGIVSFARCVLGICTLAFGMAHLTEIRAYAGAVPKWMPLGATFWVVLTGIAFLLAGLAIVSRVRDIIAARLAALMILMFSILSKIPLIITYPHDHGAWGTNVYNVTAVAAYWVLASSLATIRTQQVVPTTHVQLKGTR